MEKQGSFVACAQCGNLVYRMPSSLRRSVIFFCNKICGGKWRFAHGLKEKIAAAYNPKALPIYHPDLKHAPGLAYIIGVLIGDGSVGKSAIRLSVKSPVFAHSFSKALANIGIPNRVGRQERGGRYGTYYVVQVKSSLFAKWYRGTDIGWATLFPTDLVRGFYESEGSYGAKCISICNSDIRKLGLIEQGLYKLDFHPSQIKQYQPTVHQKPMFRIYIRKREMQGFIEKINPCIKRG